MSHDMRFPTMWYVPPAKAKTSLRIHFVAHMSMHRLVRLCGSTGFVIFKKETTMKSLQNAMFGVHRNEKCFKHIAVYIGIILQRNYREMTIYGHINGHFPKYPFVTSMVKNMGPTT